jgi:3-isopropylmalate/(R)-2-methylmalate dehydratase small subunit
MKQFGGQVLFLNRSDINTDEIIPAKYLTEISKEALKPHLLEDLKLEGFNRQDAEFAAAQVIVTRDNFGCGSSREHAPWALEVNGINLIVASSLARIFRQNMFNCGLLAVELDKNQIDTLFSLSSNAPIICQVDLEKEHLVFTNSTKESHTFKFALKPFDKTLVQTGGWLEYADKKY